jgi:hypothetical protein
MAVAQGWNRWHGRREESEGASFEGNRPGIFHLPLPNLNEAEEFGGLADLLVTALAKALLPYRSGESKARFLVYQKRRKLSAPLRSGSVNTTCGCSACRR